MTKCYANNIPSGVLPLVLHRIMRDSLSSWEDIHIDLFDSILTATKGKLVNVKNYDRHAAGKWLLTFDDGNYSDYDIAFPLLKKYSASAIFFVITDYIGTAGYLSRENILEMSRHGMSFGSHGKSHQNLTKLSNEDVTCELLHSRELLEDMLGSPISSFSYPFGYRNARIDSIARTCGYENLFSSKHGYTRTSGIIPRNSINKTYTNDQLPRVLFPSFSQRLSWMVEDSAKEFIKKTIGGQGYYKLRTLMYKRN